MMTLIGISVCWLACGILAQGMCRYNFVKIVDPAKEYGPGLILLVCLIIVGPIGLVAAISKCFVDRTCGLKFTYNKTREKIDEIGDTH